MEKNKGRETLPRWAFYEWLVPPSAHVPLFYLDFLTDTPEIVRENIMWELERIVQHFGQLSFYEDI